jgi:hypothetical protein
MRATVRHHHSFGWWRMAQRRHGGDGLAPRHVAVIGVAAVGVIAGAAALVRPRSRRAALLAAGIAYLAAAVGATVSATRLRQARSDLDLAPFDPVGVVAAPALAAVIDVAWVAGLVRGRLRSRSS